MRPKKKPSGEFNDLASDLAKESIVTQCLARYIGQILEEVHESRIAPLHKALAEARVKIEIDERRMTLAWEALEAAISFLLPLDLPDRPIKQLNDAKHALAGREAMP